ncbi:MULTISPECIES: hypothetical protein [Halobacterium]|uniref:hypothetical protein n=1 Tax=Halobacterium TaxID=2239 RepID=UPI00073E9896|nr:MULTISPECIES: hypothetical protein [Halobacterium]MCG1002782.1 hypothetical protein [Halobacterium noricense]
MRPIWDDDGLSSAFVSAFEAWADRNDGDIEETTEQTLFCEFPPTDEQIRLRVGLYEADGRHRLRFETVREEVELKLLTRFETTESKLILQSDKASRTFQLDVQAGEWRIQKRPVADV